MEVRMPYIKFPDQTTVLNAVANANGRFIIQRYSSSEYRLYNLAEQSDTPSVDEVLGDSSKLNDKDYICSWRGMNWMSRIDYAMEEFLLADIHIAFELNAPLPDGFTNTLVDEVELLGSQKKTLNDYLIVAKKILGI